MRVFLDTNVLASALATRGLCTDLFRLVLAEHELVVGEVVLDELRRVLNARFRVPAARVAEVEELLRAYEVVDRPGSPDRWRFVTLTTVGSWPVHVPHASTR